MKYFWVILINIIKIWEWNCFGTVFHISIILIKIIPHWNCLENYFALIKINKKRFTKIKSNIHLAPILNWILILWNFECKSLVVVGYKPSILLNYFVNFVALSWFIMVNDIMRQDQYIFKNKV